MSTVVTHSQGSESGTLWLTNGLNGMGGSAGEAPEGTCSVAVHPCPCCSEFPPWRPPPPTDLLQAPCKRGACMHR